MREDDLIREVCLCEKIYIYGAGMVGSLVLKRLLCGGVESSRISFVVTDDADVTEFMHHKVYCIDDIRICDNYIIIVSALKKTREQMLVELKVRGMQDYIFVDEELFEDMESNYVSDFQRNSIIASEEKDVLLVASDNNSSSGAFLCLIDLSRELTERGVRNLVVLPSYGSGEQLLIDNNIQYTYVLSKDWLQKDGSNVVVDLQQINEKAVQKLEELIEQYHIKLVHNNTTYTYVGAVAALNKRIPFVWHIREFIREQGYWFIDEEKAYELINKADCIIPVSKYVADCYDGFSKEKLQMVYDGVDVERYYWRHEILKENVTEILMPGSMYPLKGQAQMVRAAALLKERGLKFRISFVGGGEPDYIATLKELVKECELDEEICFYGRSATIEEWYRKADIVVVCSRSEAFGRVTVEGQLSGCLVIGAKCGATVELVEDGKTGLLYEVDDCEMLAEKILYACENASEMNRIAAYAQDVAGTKYSRQRNAQRIVDLYKTLIGC